MAVKKKGKLAGSKASSGPAAAKGVPYSAHQIWSAGLGAMSRAQAGGTRFFEDLVREGSRLQGGALDTAQRMLMQVFQDAQKTVNRRVDGVRGQATETWDNLEKIFQTRVQRALHQLGMPTAEEIAALSRKVDALARSVEKLAKAPAAPRKKAARKQVARKKKSTRPAARKKTRARAKASAGT